MTYEYQRVPEPVGGLRLHLNENTGGCSPAVLAAISRLSPTDMAFYPDYAPVIDACARHLSLPPDRFALTNGLDEGILAASVAWLRVPGHGRAEAIVVEPAFDEYAACADAVGGAVVTVAPREDFSFPLDRVLDAVTSLTRLVFLTNPNNPTGQVIPRPAIEIIARSIPDEALVFIDEAYTDFGDCSFLPALDGYPNVIVGRTFAKAWGLAALRAGCVIGAPEAIARMRRVIPPYSLNVCAAAGLRAALEDAPFRARYVAEVEQSRKLLYEAFGRLGLPFWPSAANFVLVRIGEVDRFLEGLAARGINVRDRSGEPGCAGCIRITAGLVEHTRACIAALEEVACGGR
jgi:histidinol-phosphate aminotransferase